MFRGSSPQLYIPAFTTVKDFQSTISHRGNLYQRGFVTTLGVPNSSLNTNTTSHKRGRPLAKQQTPLPKRVTTTKLHLTQEGANQSPDQPLQNRDTTKVRVFTTSGFFQPQTNLSFPQKQYPNRIGQMIQLKCGKTKCFEQRNSLGKTPKQIWKFGSKTISQNPNFFENNKTLENKRMNLFGT